MNENEAHFFEMMYAWANYLESDCYDYKKKERVYSDVWHENDRKEAK